MDNTTETTVGELPDRALALIISWKPATITH